MANYDPMTWTFTVGNFFTDPNYQRDNLEAAVWTTQPATWSQPTGWTSGGGGGSTGTQGYPSGG